MLTFTAAVAGLMVFGFVVIWVCSSIVLAVYDTVKKIDE